MTVNKNLIDAINTTQITYGSALRKLAAGPNTEIIKERTLEPWEIEIIHDTVISLYGGSGGIRDNRLFLSVCQAPYQEVFGAVLYPTIFDKAAKYAFDFANYQIFYDGNKRVALETAVDYLKLNGCELTLSADECYNMVMDIANGRIKDPSEISKIFQDHSYAIEISQEEKEDQEIE